MKEIFGASEGFSIDLSLDPLMGDHFGLGSTSMISCAIVFGMNDMFGGVLSKRECVDIVCNNYVEVYQGKVTAGLATGVSIHTAFNGGFVIVGSNAKLAYKSKVPKEYKIVLIKTGAKRLDMDKPENLSQLEDSKRLDQDYKYIRAYNFLMNIIPSLMQGDWDSLSSSNDCQLCGGQKGVVESYENNGEAIKNIFKKLESVPGATFGVTSVGPSVFVFTKRYEEVEALCKGIGVDFEVLDINNVGLSVSKN
jgi:predicted sugar kinase